jgi:anthranilate synthase/aminodeoxychorismate synthase-like glutamine amidotransferase
MILVVDNYDSFTYNLVQYLGELGARVEVVRNDEITIDDVAARKPEGILLSPGPGDPDSAGITLGVLSRYAASIPIFGVCLGHQAIGQAFGGRVVRAQRLMHGRTSPIHHAGKGVFAGLPTPFTATRYHSLIVERESLSPDLEITAWTDQDEIMGVAHRELGVEGVQFHPESFLTEHGHALLRNFLARLPARGARESVARGQS